MPTRRAFVAASAMLFIFASSQKATAQSQQYFVVDIPALGCYQAPYAPQKNFNRHWQVAGIGNTTGALGSLVLWDHGDRTALEAYNVFERAINDAGTIAYNKDLTNAYVRTLNGPRQEVLGPWLNCGLYNELYVAGIAADGTVAGYGNGFPLDGNVDPCGQAGFRGWRAPGVIAQSLGPVFNPTHPNDYSEAYAISSAGIIAGFYAHFDAASGTWTAPLFLWQGGNISFPPSPPGTGIGQLQAVNDAGELLGFEDLFRAWLWRPGAGWTALGFPAGAFYLFELADLNNNSQIVAAATYSNQAQKRALIWLSGAWTDLATLTVPPIGGFDTIDNMTINNDGQILISADRFTGARSLILSPACVPCAAGPGDGYLTASAALEAGSCTATAKLLGACCGRTVTFRLDGDPDTDVQATATPDAPVTVKFRGLANGTHTVAVLSPALQTRFDANCAGAVLEPPKGPPGAPDPCAAKRQRDASPMDPVYMFSGEFYEEVTDLEIPGRGLDFAWVRKYRSQAGPDTAQGNGWDFSYNIRIEANGNDLTVRDGNTRQDTFYRQPDGTYVADEMFQVCTKNLDDNTYTITFPSRGTWLFNALTGPAPGRISRITDRNGNALAFSYDSQDRLTTIHDTLDTAAHTRDITIAYNADGYISDVSDFVTPTPRRVHYEYYHNGDAGGSAGDLKSVTTPAVTGTPNGNDFPAGKTIVYTYAYHKLLTITDAKGQRYLTNAYGIAGRVTRQTWGNQADQNGPGETIDITLIPQSPTVDNSFAVMRTIVRDRIGHVKEYFYDSNNHGVIEREFTGVVPHPTAPATDDNRPTTASKLRSTDPDYFETQYRYNGDGQRSKVIHPRGNITLYKYEADLNRDPTAPRAAAGNLREVHHLPASGQGEIVERYEYWHGLGGGGCACNDFVSKEYDGRNNLTEHTYDDHGNRTQTTRTLATPSGPYPIDEEFTYNEFGQMTAHRLPDNGTGSHRRDTFTYYASGLQMGYLHVETVDADAGHFGLTTMYVYDAAGNVVRRTDPRGNDTLFTVNQLNQVVREQSRAVDTSGIRHERLTYYDANNNIVRIDVQNVNDQRQVEQNAWLTTQFEYEILNHLTRTTQEVDESHSVFTEYQYDANRNRTLVKFGEAVNGNQSGNWVRTLYDERDLVFKVIRAPETSDQSTTQTDYDSNGNVVQVAAGQESSPHVTTSTYDQYDRLDSSADAMGNVVVYEYDDSNNKTSAKTYGELTDLAGSTNNVRLSQVHYTYDSLNRLVSTEASHFDPAAPGQPPIDAGTTVTQTIYSDTSQATSVIDHRGHAITTRYDTANRPSEIIDDLQNRTTITYDENSNILSITHREKSDLGNIDESFTTTNVYDNLDRLDSSTDNAGNVTTFGYDSRSNRTRAMDPLGNVTIWQFDGLGRLKNTIRRLTANDAITTTQAWDDSSRLITQTDDRGNATSYAYDALNRRIVTRMADGTISQVGSGALWPLGQSAPNLSGFSTGYDVHDNAILTTDANGTVVTATYDVLNRLATRTITPGSGVSDATTNETYKYDGLSRFIYGQNNSSLVTRAYDSMDNLLLETQNGRTFTSLYDDVGNRTRVTYPSGRNVDATFDALNRRKTISGSAGATFTYDYIGPSRVEERRAGTANTASFMYNDPIGRVTQTTHLHGTTVIDDRTYAWDAVSNKTQRHDTRTGGPGLNYAYQYDSAYRLTHTHVTNGSNATVRDSAYTLDGANNRSAVTADDCPGAYTCSSALPTPADCQVNQYTATPCDARTYDPNGNLTNITTPPFGPQTQVTYDYRNRMISRSMGDYVATYAYDVFDRRISKCVAQPGAIGQDGPQQIGGEDPDNPLPIGEVGSDCDMTYYFYDGWQEVEERDVNANVLATYVYGNGPDEVLTMRRDANGDGTPEDYYYHADDLGNIMALTNASGAVVERYDYADYGRPIITSPTGSTWAQSAVGNPYMFTGRRFDPETGWYYFRTRYLDPIAGRFTTRDTIGIWGDPLNLGNGCAYTGNNPWTRLDPLGMDWWDNTKAFAKGAAKALAVATVATAAAALAPVEIPAGAVAIVVGAGVLYTAKGATEAITGNELLTNFQPTGNTYTTEQRWELAGSSAVGIASIGYGAAQFGRAGRAFNPFDPFETPQETIANMRAEAVNRALGPLARNCPPRPGSISGNPANRLVETGRPLKNGTGWVQKWTRMTAEEEQAQARAVSERYAQVLEETKNLSGDQQHQVRFEKMQEFRTQYRQQFLQNRKKE